MRLDSFPPPRRLFRTPLDCNSPDRLRELQQDLPDSIFATFFTWHDVRDWLSAAGDWNEKGDAVLRPVLAAFKRAPDETWYHVLLFLFWPGLDRIARRLWLLGGDHAEELDSQIHWAFRQALHRLDLSRRPSRLGQKLLNDVQCDVRRHYERERAHRERTQPSVRDDEDDESEDLGETLGDVDPAFEHIDGQHDVRWARAYLKDFVRRGHLSRADYLILVGCRLYGHSLREMAGRLGLSYAATRKREQRATKFLREYARKLSHGEGRDPLNQVWGHSPRKEES